jgi:hypothetical protein
MNMPVFAAFVLDRPGRREAAGGQGLLLVLLFGEFVIEFL